MKNLTHLLLLLLASVMISCSGGSDALTVDVYGLDQMQYAVQETADHLQTGDEVQVNGETYYLLEGINAETGQSVTINLTTISTMQPAAMSHNWILLEMGTDPQSFALDSQTATDNNYISPDLQEQVIVNTDMLGGGESDTITFTAPEEAGDYDYLCTFPGHYTGGMYGVLSVEQPSAE